MGELSDKEYKKLQDQIKELEECGCELVRVAVPDAEAAGAIRTIKKGISIPLIADIHFDYRLAQMALVQEVHVEEEELCPEGKSN